MTSSPPVAMWIRTAESTADDGAAALSAAADESLTITGRLTAHLTFDPGRPDEAALDPRVSGHDDMFFAVYGADGTLRSTKHAAESSTVTGYARVLVDGSAVVLEAAGMAAAIDPAITVPASAAFFVAKYRPDGSFAWAKGIEGASDAATAGALAVWEDGSVLIGGILKGTLTFGMGEPNETRLAATLTNAPSGEIYLARLDAAGNLAWARRAISAWYLPDGWKTVALADGGLALLSAPKGTTIVDPDLPSTVTLSSSGHGFMVKYDASGKLSWLKTIEQTQGQSGFANVTELADGTILACGSFTGVATFGTGDPHPVVLSAAGSEHPSQTQFPDLFLARYGANGALEWAIREGGSIWDNAGQVAAYPDGSVLLAGTFGNTVKFGVGSRAVTLTVTDQNMSPTDFFLAHYDAGGSLLWARRSVDASQIAPLSDGGVALAGSYSGTKRFFPGEPAEATLAALGGEDLFIARLAPAKP
jgi:hypothetical protein